MKTIHRALKFGILSSFLLGAASSNAIAQTPAAPRSAQAVRPDARLAVQPRVNATAASRYQQPPATRMELSDSSAKILSTTEPVVTAIDGVPVQGSVVPMGEMQGSSIPMMSEGAEYSYGPGYGTGKPSRFAAAQPHRHSHHQARGSDPMVDPCAPPNCRAYYLTYEALWLEKMEDQAFTVSQGRFMNGFNYNQTARYTLGQMFDCTDGVEVVYTGPVKWSRGRLDTDGTGVGTLNSIITTSGGYVPAQVDAFNGAVVHRQIESARLQSFEFNRRWYAWDVVSTLIGVRGFQYTENFQFDSVDAGPGAPTGLFRTNTRNFLIGGQIGADMLKPVSQRLNIGSRSRLGVFANFNEGQTLLVNRGTQLLNANRDDVDLSAMIQYGPYARYQILPNVVATVNYELLYLAGIATVSNQGYTPVSPSLGTKYNTRDSVFVHGGGVGIEVSF